MNVLIVAAHQDDEVLGAGATINKIIRNGGKVAVYSLSQGSPTREDGLEQKQRESLNSFGKIAIYTGNLTAMKFQECDRYTEVRKIESVIEQERPDTIITHFPKDLHNDHRITAEFVMEAAKLPQRGGQYDGPLPTLLFMEVLTSTEWNAERTFSPTYFEEVSKEDLENKVNALKVYREVLRKTPHPRNRETIEALARYRGAQAGVRYAEAFELAMEVNRLGLFHRDRKLQTA